MTGSTSGIGRATAERFGVQGAHVIAHGLPGSDEGVVTAVRRAGGECTLVLGDLRRAEDVRALIVEASSVGGAIDVLVNNAGENVGVLDTAVAEWDACLELDLRAAWLCAREAARSMPRGAAIVTVSSNHAVSTLPGAFPYNVAKAGLLALNQSLAVELADRGIRSNAVVPGYVDTPINVAYFGAFADPGEARQRAEALHPLRRLARPDEIAAAIEFLADEATAGFITGTALTVDGGRSALLQDPDAAAASSHR